MFWSPRFFYILTVSLKKVPEGPGTPYLLYVTAIPLLTYKIYIPFHFPVRRNGAYRHKKALSLMQYLNTQPTGALC